MALVQASLWQSLQFGDKDAFRDFLGQHGLWHDQLDAILRQRGGPPYSSFPLGDGPLGDGGDWHLTHQDRHEGAASSLGLSAPTDFTAYDLNRRDDFSTWIWIHAQEHIRLAQAAGL